MRLPVQEQWIIRDVVLQELPGASVYLFGSMTDDTGKGGDIDILVIGDGHIGLDRLLRVKVLLKERLGDRKIDLVYQEKEKLSLFAQSVLPEAVRL